MNIRFENVSYIINKRSPLEKTILKNVSFSINKSGIYAFLGSSNSGKTHIGKLIDTLITPDYGQVVIDDVVSSKKRIKRVNALRKNIAVVYKNPYDMFFCKTVKEEITFAALKFKYKVKDRNNRLKNACKLLKIDESLLNKNPFSLSLSDAKKVSLASVLSFNPKTVILDEYEIGLSKEEKDDLIRIIKIMHDEYDKTIILLSKDTDFIYSFVEEVYIFNKGKYITKGTYHLLEDENLMHCNGLDMPQIVKFIKAYNEKKNLNIPYYKDIKDLIKEVYRNAN